MDDPLRWLALLPLALAAAAAAAPPEPAPADYAWSWPIETTAVAGYYALALPEAVYRSVADPGLRDLAVFDARGTPVPRWIDSPAPAAPPPGATRELVVLPVLAAAGTPAAALQLELERSGERTTLRIDNAAAGSAAARVPVAGLADLGGLHADLRAIDLDWPADGAPLLTRVTVEGSTDLQQWFALGSGTIAALREGDVTIERRRVGLEPRELRYLRLTWGATPPGWRITRLTAHFAAATPAAARTVLALQPAGRDADGGWLYDSVAAFPVDRLAVERAGEFGLLRATISAWLAGEQRWQPVHAGLFYRLRRGDEVLAGDPAPLPPQRVTRWKVVIDSGSAAPGPTLRLGWAPDRLLFAAQGEGPWRLAAGSARDREQGFPQQRRYADPGMRQLLLRTGPPGTARLGDRQEEGGPQRLQAPRRGPWRRWLLWLALLAGVAVVGGMAASLLRQPGGGSRPGA